MGNQWSDIYLCVPKSKCWGGRVPPSPYNRRPWAEASANTVNTVLSQFIPVVSIPTGQIETFHGLQ